MIIRSIVEHARKHNWSEVLVELVIVIVGVFVAIELGNWNEDRKARGSERSYLDRIAAEIQVNVDLFSAYEDTEELARAAAEQFAVTINDPSSTDADLVQATEIFFSQGWTFPMFEPVVTTFEELETTGALQVIHNSELRDAIVGLYAKYDQIEGVLAGNIPWQLSIDARLTYEFDALRWDDRTSHLFAAQSVQESAGEVRESIQSLTRIAAVHYWLQDRMLGQYEEAIALSDATLEKIESELAGR